MKQPGKRVQLYGGLETSFGVPPTLLVTHALRHISAQFDHDPLNRVFSPEKKAGPARYVRFDRHETAGYTLEAILRSSGTLNTLPECSFALEAAFGAKNNITLSTTVNAGTGAVGGATLASATGLVAKKTAVLITCPDGKKRLRRITTVNVGTGVVTWAPVLPAGQLPADGAAVKAANCYYFTAANAVSLFLARYTVQADFTAGFSEIIKGAMADRLSLMFGSTDEPRFTLGGPGKTKVDAPTIPAGFTQVGTNPPSGMTSEVQIGANLARFLKLAIEVTNGLELRQDENNTTAASEGYRMGDRDLTFGLDVDAENTYQGYHYDIAKALSSEPSLFEQTGFTEGKAVAVFAPRMELKDPTANVGDAAIQWPFKGVLLEETEDSNDELVLMLG